MSLLQIRYLVAVTEEDHVGRAAERPHTAQPTLRRQIRTLEGELGAPIFLAQVDAATAAMWRSCDPA